MIGQKLQDEINAQINAELYSAYLYLSMSAFFEYLGYPGAANWMKIQAMEEFTHADKFFNYLNERGGKVMLFAIDQPDSQWDSALDVFEAVLKHEKKVTARINHLFDIAVEEKDHAAEIFLQWFVEEQVEEEKSASDVIDQVKLAAQAPGAMFMIDKELAQRTFNPPEN